MRTTFELEFQTAEYISSRVKHFTFTLPEKKNISFTAGQFISLHIEKDGKTIRRNYSIANSPNKSTVVELACSYIEHGLASELLFNLPPHTTLTASGPYGAFVLPPENPQRYILVATGTGVTPYLSMLSELTQKLQDSNLEVILLFGTRSIEEVLYRDVFIDFAQQHKNFQYIISYSRQLPDTLESFERSGHVQDHFAEFNINAENDICYLCGNPFMVDEAFAQLQNIGLPRPQIKREKYISSR